jgi:small subunit ribosomal protein S6e
MAKFKIIISDPETGKSRFVEVEGTQAVPLVGRRMGDVIDGSVVKMSGQKLEITGGSDKDGFPMRPNVHGGVRARAILSEGVGFHPSQKGERRRKTLRGDIVTEDIVQINMKIVEKPKKAEKPKGKKKEIETGEKKREGEATEETAQTA